MPASPPIITEIRHALVANPGEAEALARADQERFPDGPYADERDALLVAAIFNQHDPLRARLEGRNYLTHHPNGRYVDFLKKYARATLPPSPAPR